MRNIAIADREDWVFAQPARPPSSTPRSKLRDALATLPIVLLIPALIVPVVTAAAGGPRISLTPDEVVAGGRVSVMGSGFEPGETGHLVWASEDDDDDDDREAIAAYRATARGRFALKVDLPAGLDEGEYEWLAIDDDGEERDSAEIEVVADASEGTEAAGQPEPEPATDTAKEAAPAATAAPTKAPTPAKATKPAPPAGAPIAPRSTASPRPTVTPRSTAVPRSTVAPARSTAASTGGAILMSAAEIGRLPMSGAAWVALKAKADSALSTPNISNQDDNTDQLVLAKAIVYARTGTTTYRAAVLGALKKALGTEAGGRTLALGRNLPAYVISADLISLRTLDPAFDSGSFRPWLRALLSKTLDGMTLRQTHERRPNNWGTHAGAARAAIAAYLGDSAEMARTALVFRGYLGDRSAYAGFKYGDLSWQCDPARPVGINPTGCSRSGINLDGALPEEMRRGGGLRWPPAPTGYPWEGLQGAVLQAELLRVAGYDAWNWSDRALLRAVKFLYGRVRWAAEGDDTWQPWLIDRRYGTSYRSKPPARSGKNFGYTDWLTGL